MKWKIYFIFLSLLVFVPFFSKPEIYATDSNSNVGALYKKAIALHNAGKDTSALILCNKILKAAPTFADVLVLKGKILFKLKHYKKAYRAFSAALKIKPDLPEALYLRSIVLARYRNYDFALLDIDKYLALSPGDTRALKIRKIILKRMKRAY